MGNLENDKIFKPGDRALAVLDYSEKTIDFVTLVDHYRIDLIAYVGLAFAVVLVAFAGAMMDVAVDITASVDEVVKVAPETTYFQAIRSGFNVGRAVMGTMTTTLLLAYSGGFISLLMVFMAQGTPLINILNLKYVSSEILHTLIGSLGLVTVSPFTALTSGYLLTKNIASK